MNLPGDRDGGGDRDFSSKELPPVELCIHRIYSLKSVACWASSRSGSAGKVRKCGHFPTKCEITDSSRNRPTFMDENKHFPCCNYFGNWQEIKSNRWKTCNILVSTANWKFYTPSDSHLLLIRFNGWCGKFSNRMSISLHRLQVCESTTKLLFRLFIIIAIADSIPFHSIIIANSSFHWEISDNFSRKLNLIAPGFLTLNSFVVRFIYLVSCISWACL